MTTQFATSLATEQDSFKAGKITAQQSLKKLGTTKPSLAVLFCSARYDHSAVIRGIRSVVGDQVALIGCTSAGQFTDKGVAEDGVACALVASDTHHFFSGIGTELKSNPLEAIRNAVNTFPKHISGYPHQSAILLVDGLAGKGEEAVLAASSILGPSVRFAGGAAADNLNFKETSVFSNDQSFSNAASVCFIASRAPIIISSKHGHRPISPPLLITKAKDNVLYELENRPALDVWKDHLREKLNKQGIDIDHLSISEMSKLLLKYEAGLMTGTDYKIRFPASCNPDGSLNFVCSIVEGAVIKIMDSEKKDQIAAAREAAELALSSTEKGMNIAGAIIFECACRAMILKDQFPKAVEASQKILGTIPFIGCETYGEIAMESDQLSGFHNTTTVIMLFPS